MDLDNPSLEIRALQLSDDDGWVLIILALDD